MLDRVCQLMEEVIPSAPRVFVAQTINVCIHLTLDRKHPAGRRLTGVDRVCGLGADGQWRLQPVA
jgi:type IV secretion system protein VirB11